MLPAGSTPRAGRRPRARGRGADAVAGALGRLGRRTGTAVEAPPAPTLCTPGIELVDRPGAVQSNIRLGGPAPRRTDPDLAAVRLANMIFGGYFSSRLVENIRERRGYTYSPRSSVDHQAAGSSFLVEADVATEVTGPALLETWYELGRMALTAGHRGRAGRRPPLHPGQHGAVHGDPRRAWPARSRRWSAPACRPTGWPSTSRRLAAVTVEQVQEASRRYLARGRR